MADRRLGAAALLVLTVALWEWGSPAPQTGPSGVAATMLAHPALLTEASAATLRSAALGLLGGTLVGVAAAWTVRLLPASRTPVARTLLVTYSVPLVGVGPLLATVLQRDAIPAVSAAIGVAFPVFATVQSGLAREPASYRTLLDVFGARRRAGLWLITLPYSVPFLLEAVRLAVPAALLGTLIGEWFGAQRGLGVLLASGLRESQDDLVMAVTVLVVAQSVASYALITGCARAVGRRRGLVGAPA